MAKLLAAWLADPHLRPSVWGKHPDLCGDAYVSFAHVVSYCIQYQVPLFGLGDLLDSATPDAASVVFLCRQMDRLQQARLPYYYIDGNHDKSPVSWPKVHLHATHIDLQQVTVDGVTVFGLDYRPRGVIQQYLADYANINSDILATHQAWSDMMTIGSTDAAFADIKAGEKVPTILTGDYHVHGVFTGRLADGRPITAYSPGSTCMQKLNEAPDKFFYTLWRDDYGALRWDTVAIPTRPFYAFNCVTPADLDRTIVEIQRLPSEYNHLPPEIRKPILKVDFSDTIPDALSRLVAAAGDNFFLFDVSHHNMTDTVVDAQAAPPDAFTGLVNAVGQLKGFDSPAYLGVKRLLESNDPKAELEAICTEYLAAN